MTARLASVKTPIRCGNQAALAVLVGLVSVPALASTSVAPECPESQPRIEVKRIAAPDLKMDLIEPAIANTAIDEQIDKVSVGTATGPSSSIESSKEALIEKIFEDGADAAEVDGVEAPPAEPPASATRILDAADDELPRFRRQMYRTDI